MKLVCLVLSRLCLEMVKIFYADLLFISFIIAHISILLAIILFFIRVVSLNIDKNTGIFC